MTLFQKIKNSIEIEFQRIFFLIKFFVRIVWWKDFILLRILNEEVVEEEEDEEEVEDEEEEKGFKDRKEGEEDRFRGKEMWRHRKRK